MEFGQKLKEARNRAGLKQEELAQTIGVSRQTVSNWENNRSYPDIGSLMKLSDLYGISLDELLKEDRKIQEHFAHKAAKKKRFWQLVLEYALVAEIVGILFAGQDFTTLGYGLQIIGSVWVWIALWMHIRLFDHTKEEISRFVLGFSIMMLGALVELVFPQFLQSTSLLVVFFLLIRSTGPLLVLYSNVWRQFWKSPRFWLILLLLIGVPFFNLMTNLQSAGTLNTNTPFSQDYRIETVLYPEDQEADPEIRIDLREMLNTHTLRIYKNGDDYATIGSFTYQEPTANQTDKGIWLLIPEEDPKALYRLSVDADDRVILSYSQQEQLQWKWLLREEYSCRLQVATFGHTMFTNPDWLLPGEADPVPYFTHTDVAGKAKLTITLPVADSLILQEEYHHGDQVAYTDYQLLPNDSGSYTLEVETRYDGKQEYALYRIPYKDGSFRFCLTFDVGAKTALYEMWANK